jgi:hypothetical protein
MKILFAFFFFFFGVSYGYSQSSAAETQGNLQSMGDGGGMFRSFDNRKKDMKGSNLVFDEYLPGGITMNEGTEFDFNRMNYDGYFDAIIVVRKKQEQVVTTMMVKAFYIVDVIDTLYFERLLRTDNRMGYYQRMTEGKNVRLLKKLFTTLNKATYTGAYSLGSTESELVHGFSYYVQDGTMRPKEFNNKKMLLELFPEEKDKLSDFMKASKTDFKKDVEVISVIEYLDSIREGKN